MKNSRSFNGKTTDLGNSNVADVAIRDLELVLKFQKSVLDRLYFHSLVDNLPVKMTRMFKMLHGKIKTRKLTIKANYMLQVDLLLQVADPESLKSLDLIPLEERMRIESDVVVKTEQWEKAKALNCDMRLLNLQVEDICHFSRLSLRTHSFNAVDLDILRKVITRSSNFERLRLHDSKEQEECSDIWGPAFDSGYSSQWYFRMKDSEEKVLSIEICRSVIYFDSIEITDVSEEAIVQDYNEY
ncbi:hypothetical protein B9Z55_021221 [Caenorhabditis nigoni]|nr:hypothetical protein B9Z55_021221 [Caenorhabditis nigoni]